jgi:hypothetical protein
MQPKNGETLNRKNRETENKIREMELWRNRESSMGEILHTIAVEILLRAPKTEFFSLFLHNSISRFSVSLLVEFFLNVSRFFKFNKKELKCVSLIIEISIKDSLVSTHNIFK